MDNSETQLPFARATITPDRLTLNAWNPGLIGLGPRNRLLDGLDDRLVLADLTIERRQDANELVVEVITGDLAGGAGARLASWACDAGYRRLWLPQQVICLEAERQPLGPSETECPTCGVIWTDESPGFLVQVRQSGFFPPACLACGGSLPEWTVGSLPSDEAMAFIPADPHGASLA